MSVITRRNRKTNPVPLPWDDEGGLITDDCINLEEWIPKESVSIAYADPPFRSDRMYNMQMPKSGDNDDDSSAQEAAFDDIWHFDENAANQYRVLTGMDTKLAHTLRALRERRGECGMLAYITYMAARIQVIWNCLHVEGSMFLHCDPNASHLLRGVMDDVFGPENFRNEIIWQRSNAHNNASRLGAIHDTIFYYTKSSSYVWNPISVPYSASYIDSAWHELPSDPTHRYKCNSLIAPSGGGKAFEWRGTTARWALKLEALEALWNRSQTDVPRSHGRIKLRKDGTPAMAGNIMLDTDEEAKGVSLQDIWTDILRLAPNSKERLGFQTQKPEALLDRIIRLCSNPGDVVLDPFLGSGTTASVAHVLGRRWVGSDIKQKWINQTRQRLKETYPDDKITIALRKRITDMESLRDLCEHDKPGFEAWAMGELGVRTKGEIRKGRDQSKDGLIIFQEDNSPDYKTIKFSVRGGNISVDDVLHLAGQLHGDHDTVGVLVTFKEPTPSMRTKAVDVGEYHSPYYKRDFKKLQILTAEKILYGTRPDLPIPPRGNRTWPRSAPRRPDTLPLPQLNMFYNPSDPDASE